MARRNPELELLEREVAMLRRQLTAMRADPGDIPFTACDNSCVVAYARGVATNGGCRCDERKLRRAVQYWRGVAQHRQAIIQMLRDEPKPGDCSECGEPRANYGPDWCRSHFYGDATPNESEEQGRSNGYER